ncbi:hypothetical protein J2W17_003195 [Pseudomonas lini]|uniref:hypothetical protein n=1 Tax=Pseudomonas lini TaxID=163011 RepID=UPI00277D9EBA|nr:hypothetical protein [Pseudomonas lini]MDQ0124247.1 hypothetical protein [Pseudomonas lini]
MTILKNAVVMIALALLSGFALGGDASPTPTLVKKQQLYVGNESCNNGEVTTYDRHKGCGTEKIGYTIDDASAMPRSNFIEVFSGNDTVNNKIVSKNPNHLGGSAKSIGYLSKQPITGGEQIRSGNEPCNNGTATLSTLHLGCGTEFLGYALPQK